MHAQNEPVAKCFRRRLFYIFPGKNADEYGRKDEARSLQHERRIILEYKLRDSERRAPNKRDREQVQVCFREDFSYGIRHLWDDAFLWK